MMLLVSCFETEDPNAEGTDTPTQSANTDDFVFDAGEIPPLALDSNDLLTSDRVRVHALSDLEHLNFAYASDAQSTEMGFQTHQYLYYLNPKTYDFVPVLAKERAIKGEDENGNVTLDFEIRPEATWDNGSPITGHDMVYSLKIVFVPGIEDIGSKKPYLDYIGDIIVDKDNPKKFRVVCNKRYMSVETSVAVSLIAIPPYVYDPKGVMKNYSLKEMLDSKNEKKLTDDSVLKEYAQFFNSNEFKREICAGSGPYQFVKWDTNERIVLERKKDWWGDKVNEPENPWFQAYPKRIVYTTINDYTAAVVALKGQNLDAMKAVPNKQFVEELRESMDFKGKYQLSAPPYFAYDYIGLNTRDPRLEDVKVRKGLAHLMNIEQLIKTELYGLGEQMPNFVHPLFKDRLNTDLELYKYDLQKAKAYFEEAGWGDADEDGILDKEIDGEQEDMKLTLIVNSGNDRRKSAALIFQAGCKQIGVKVDIRILEWSTFLDKVKKHDFDMYILGWAASPIESDPKQIWHTESYNNGSNYVGFGTPESDALIEKLRATVDDKERAGYYKELQKMIHDDVPYIFLTVQRNRVVLSRKYENIFGSGLRSGFLPNGFSPVLKNSQ